MVSDKMKLVITRVTSASDGVRVSVKKSSLVGVGVGVGVNSGSEVVSDRTRLVNTGVSEGVGVGVRVNSGKDVVSDTAKLLTTGVSSGVLVKGVNTKVDSD